LTGPTRVTSGRARHRPYAALRHYTWGAAPQFRGSVSPPADATMQQQPQPVVGEVAEAVPDALDLLDEEVDRLGGPVGTAVGDLPGTPVCARPAPPGGHRSAGPAPGPCGEHAAGPGCRRPRSPPWWRWSGPPAATRRRRPRRRWPRIHQGRAGSTLTHYRVDPPGASFLLDVRHPQDSEASGAHRGTHADLSNTWHHASWRKANWLLRNRCSRARFGGMQLAWRWPSHPADCWGAVLYPLAVTTGMSVLLRRSISCRALVTA
jgi:hypothetical protein